jgi:hypothetical protein
MHEHHLSHYVVPPGHPAGALDPPPPQDTDEDAALDTNSTIWSTDLVK